MRDAILQILLLQKFTKRPELRHTLMARGFVVSDRAMRKEIESMITDDHFSIGSCEHGYYLILTEVDLNGAIHALKSKAEALSIRSNCLIRNWKEGKLQDQLSLFV